MTVYSTANKINITEVDGTAFKGRYAADGSWNGVNKTGVTSYVGLINPCGAINYSIVNTSTPTTLYAANGSMNVSDQGILNGALSVSISALSAAASLLSATSNGFAFSASDSAFLASTGFYGSVCVKDTTTSSNNYNSSPDTNTASKITYTPTSPKLTLGPSGSLQYQPHNLYVNSEFPADQTVTVVPGATYAMTVTGTVSITLSGATTATVTSAATATFTTGGTTTLTCSGTTGTGTVHLRRTPCSTTYVKTGASARYTLPYEWDKLGALQGIRSEPQRSNLVLNSSNVAGHFSFSGATASAIADPAGDTKACRVTVSSAAGTNVNVNVAGAGSTSGLTYSIYAKKGSGATQANNFAMYNTTTSTSLISGNINYDTGAWTTTGGSGTVNTYDVGNDWWRIEMIKTSSINNGDSINVYACYFGGAQTVGHYADVYIPQLEQGTFATSPIETFGTSITRAKDSIKLPQSAFPWNSGTGTLKVDTITTTPTTSGSDLVIAPRSGQTLIQSYQWIPS